MRVVVLGFDGLETSIAEKVDEKAFLQEFHGFFEIGEEYKHEKEKVPYTPKIWVSIITGVPPSIHGVNSWWIEDKTGSKPKRRIINRGDLRVKTLFDEITDAIAVNVPGYNEKTEYHELLSKAATKGLEEYVKTIWEVHKLRLKDFMRELGKDEYKLLFAYFDLLDLLGHVCWHKCRLQLVRAYMEAAKIIRYVKSTVTNTALLILTDHGMKDSGDGVTGNHSDKAFWSLSVKPPITPKDFTDYYKLVLKLLGEK